MAVNSIDMHVSVKFGDSRSNGFRNIRGADFVERQKPNIFLKTGDQMITQKKYELIKDCTVKNRICDISRPNINKHAYAG